MTSPGKMRSGLAILLRLSSTSLFGATLQTPAMEHKVSPSSTSTYCAPPPVRRGVPVARGRFRAIPTTPSTTPPPKSNIENGS
eukprot:CAMPEP_0170139082 /NCGR_PEP_ID=MMETSP0033_2-20121228/5403_1 /TAXON_ID=195969 /ORGANISM="Dolichomastix tenuilepis, Strain CCMP3274" /LENGTH=82 /DNA_ID=CAMNT_0010375163 /DNA_START=107 /DNA_END=355 /DNA_ORIENTATION=-